MKNTIIISIMALFTLLSFSACRVEVINKNEDHGPITTSQIDAKDFTGIKLAYPAEIIYIPSDTFSVTLKASKKARENIMIRVKDNILEIKKPNTWNGKHYLVFNNYTYGDVYLTVKAPLLSYIAIAGSGSFKCDSTIASKVINLIIAGSGQINIKNMQAHTMAASIAGSGDIDAGLTDVDKTDIHIAGSGDINMRFKQCGSVSADIAGSGDVKLSGDIQSLHQDVSGSGDIDLDGLSIKGSKE